MASRNSFKFVMLPPQTDTTRGWAKRLAEAMPEVRVVVAEDADTAAREIADAEAAFGWLGKELLSKAEKLRWLQALRRRRRPGTTSPSWSPIPWASRICVRSTTTISAPISWRSCWPLPATSTSTFRNSCAANGRSGRWRLAMSSVCRIDHPGRWPRRHRAEAARRLAACGMTVMATDARRTMSRVGWPSCIRRCAGRPAALRRFRHPDRAAYAGDRRVLQPRPLPAHEADGVLHQYRPRHDDPAG